MFKTKNLILILLVAAISCAKPERIVTVTGETTSAGEIDAFIKSQLDSTDVIGLSVSIVNEGDIVYSGHFGKTHIDKEEKPDHKTIYEVASLSKPVFTFFVMKQVEKGVIDLDKPLYQYLENPDIKYDPEYEKMTARMVLCHASGLPNWRSEGDSLRIQFEPGTAYGYSGEGYEYLKNVLAHLLDTDDKGLDSIFQKEIAGPLGIENYMSFTWRAHYKERKAFGHENNQPTDNTYLNSKPFFQEQGPGLFASSYSLYSTSDAYAKFLIAITQNKVLDDDTIGELLRQQTGMPVFPDTDMPRSLLSFIKKTPQGLRYFHTGDNGDFQAWMHFYPSNGFGIVILTNGDNLFSSGVAENLLVFLNENVGRN